MRMLSLSRRICGDTLWDAKHCIRKEHKPHLMQLVKTLLYADTDNILAVHYAQLLSDEAGRKLPTFINIIQHLYQCKEEWVNCYCKEFPVRGNNNHSANGYRGKVQETPKGT